MYGLFILKSGNWQLHATDATRSAFLEQELAYLVNSLGLRATIFQKKA